MIDQMMVQLADILRLVLQVVIYRDNVLPYCLLNATQARFPLTIVLGQFKSLHRVKRIGKVCQRFPTVILAVVINKHHLIAIGKGLKRILYSLI